MNNISATATYKYAQWGQISGVLQHFSPCFMKTRLSHYKPTRARTHELQMKLISCF